MKTITRKYYEEILDCYDAICSSNGEGILKYFEIKNNLILLLKKINQYNLLNLNLSHEFYSLLETKDEKSIDEEREKLLQSIYPSLLNVSIEKNHFSTNEPNYLISLEKSLIKLPFKTYSNINDHILKTASDSYPLKFHYQKFETFSTLNTEKDYTLYKKELEKDKSAIRFVGFPKNRTVLNSNLLTLNSNCHNEK
ncbi:hypothetical protein, partial [Sinomicrobium soli]|uniref:hypothetical protein n=1 Tax=Sinomicrobium sp. N-1-3-6 TaxID=2219864 RepID=UPI000DCC065B